MGSDHLPLIGGMSEPRARSGKEATGLSGGWKHSMRMPHREWDLVAEITPWLRICAFVRHNLRAYLCAPCERNRTTYQKQKSKKPHTPIAARVPRPHPHSQTH